PGGAHRRHDRAEEGTGRAGRRHRRELAHRPVDLGPARGAGAVAGRGVVMSPRYVPWDDYSTSGPIAVEGGIKAKSKRGAIGEQWWSRRFIAVLECVGVTGRLQRGRTYAPRGQ